MEKYIISFLLLIIAATTQCAVRVNSSEVKSYKKVSRDQAKEEQQWQPTTEIVGDRNQTADINEFIYDNPDEFHDKNQLLHEKHQHASHEFAIIEKFLRSYIIKVPSPECSRQLEMFAKGLSNASLWAVQMLDASAKIPFGLITANTYQLGHYDECVQIATHSVRGKYCIADIHFQPTIQKYPDYYNGYVESQFSLHYDPYKPVWEKFKKTEDPSKKRRDTFHMGVCVPAACGAADVQKLYSDLTSDLAKSIGYRATVQVAADSCSTNEPKPLTAGFWIMMWLLSFFLGSVVICTAWDLTRSRQKVDLSNFEQLLEAFSINKNVKKLSADNSSEDTNVFNGMKFYTVTLILLGHRCVHSYGAPFFNPQFLEERYRKMEDMFLLNGSLIVDTFFIIGGYLTCLALLKELQGGGKVRPSQVYLLRWFKITPVYMLVVFFYGHVLEHLGSGPIWNMKVGREAQRCRENWWANLLYINNYFTNKEMCMFQSWYISCDMHYTLLAPMLATALVKNVRRGVTYLIGIIALATIIPFLTTYIYEYDGVLRVYMQIFEDLPKNRTFADMYIKSHHRAVPYFIGMLAAFVFTKLQAIQYKFPQWMVWGGSITSTILSVWAIWGAWFFYIPGRKYSAMENALYAATHRLAWGIAMAWIPIAGGRKAFGIIQPILSKQALAPLSRLSLGAFLVHAAVQLFFTSSMRVPEFLFFPKLFWMTAGDLIFSFLTAFMLHVFFEAPANGITKFLITKRTTQITKLKMR